MAIKAENREVYGIVIGMIFIHVMYLNRPASRAADAARPIRFKDDLICDLARDFTAH